LAIHQAECELPRRCSMIKEKWQAIGKLKAFTVAAVVRPASQRRLECTYGVSASRIMTEPFPAALIQKVCDFNSTLKASVKVRRYAAAYLDHVAHGGPEPQEFKVGFGQPSFSYLRMRIDHEKPMNICLPESHPVGIPDLAHFLGQPWIFVGRVGRTIVELVWLPGNRGGRTDARLVRRIAEGK
jgi:hypothetical protein